LLPVAFLQPFVSNFAFLLCEIFRYYLQKSSFGFLISLWKHKMTISSTFFHHFIRYYLGGDFVIVISSYYRQGKLRFSIVVGLAEM
jgi:hypothetical protein